MKKEMTKSKAIRLRCLDCHPDNRADVTRCKDIDCALHGYRMGNKISGYNYKMNRLKAIREYCLWCGNGSKKEVLLCPDKSCSLYNYRLGRNPGKLKPLKILVKI